MADADELKSVLSGLKEKAEPKAYREQPKGSAICCGFVFTCCIENNQLMLAISMSPGTKDPPISEDELSEAIVSVFGRPQARFDMYYPMRGSALVLSWPVEGGDGFEEATET